MKVSDGVFRGLLCLVVLSCLACGGQDEVTPADPGTEGNPEPAAAPSSPETPEDVGEAIGAIYVDAMKKVIEMGKDHPPFEEIKPKLKALKDECISRLVKLGKVKDGLAEEQKAKINRTVRAKMAEVRSLFTEYGNAANYYMNKDRETYELFTSFNVITQYADFDLLRKQEPEEAKRLGIE